MTDFSKVRLYVNFTVVISFTLLVGRSWNQADNLCICVVKLRRLVFLISSATFPKKQFFYLSLIFLAGFSKVLQVLRV